MKRQGPSVRVRGRWWRVLVPKWAFDPLSGAGAARYGGRFNQEGVAALYLSGDVATAVAEYQNLIAARPGTFCVFAVDVAGVVDGFEPRHRRAWRIAPGDFATDWRAPVVKGDVPRTHRLARRLRAGGAAGLVYPSRRRAGGKNLVLWRWNDSPDRRVAVIDAQADLPSDRSSWREP